MVKVQTEKKLTLKNFSKALKFFRKPTDLESKNIYQHIGIYQYKVSILKKFVKLNQTKNEKKYRLEQLRALDNQINIDVVLAKRKHRAGETFIKKTISSFGYYLINKLTDIKIPRTSKGNAHSFSIISARALVVGSFSLELSQTSSALSTETRIIPSPRRPILVTKDRNFIQNPPQVFVF